MEENLLSMNHLKKMIESFKQEILEYNLSIYVFGSYVNEKTYNDIDILVLYLIKKQDILPFIKFKNRFKSELEKISGEKIDLTILTYEENDETNFKEHEKAIELISYKYYK